MHIRIATFVCFFCLLHAAAAQQAQLLSTDGPHYTGIPVELQVAAEGFAESPQPEIEPPRMTDATLEFIGVSPSVNTSIQVVNGRMTQSRVVRFNFNYRFVAAKPGNYEIGPFTVSQGSQRVTTNSLTLALTDIPRAENQRIELILPAKTLYVGQRVPLRVEWWAQADLQNKLYNHRLHLPLFFMSNDFRVEQAKPGGNAGNSRLVVDTENGARQFDAVASAADFNGERHIVIATDFVIIPLKAGVYEFEPAMLSVDEVIRWRRNLFGDRVPTHARKRRVESDPLRFDVAQVPQSGKPASFAGAIGAGFSLEVSADRSVVQVGDPITLTLTVKGDAGVENLSLPGLENLGLPGNAFRQPSGEVAGDYQNGARVFKVPVRVLNDTVDEIPPLNFSWFDPEQERYQTTRSQPIALSVRQARIVSAQDVVSSQPKPTDEQTGQAEQRDRSQRGKQAEDESATAQDSVNKQRFTLSGAELSIERDINKLAKQDSGWLDSPAAQALCYATAFAVVVLAWLSHRRSQRDPKLAERTRQLMQLSKNITKAKTVAETAAAIRSMAAAAPAFPRKEFDLLLAECDARVYAPGGNRLEVDKELRQRAITFADAVLETAQ